VIPNGTTQRWVPPMRKSIAFFQCINKVHKCNVKKKGFTSQHLEINWGFLFLTFTPFKYGYYHFHESKKPHAMIHLGLFIMHLATWRQKIHIGTCFYISKRSLKNYTHICHCAHNLNAMYNYKEFDLIHLAFLCFHFHTN